MYLGFEYWRSTLAGALAAGVLGLCAGPAQSGGGSILIGIEVNGHVPETARRRLARYLEDERCVAEIHFTGADPEMALVFQPGIPEAGEPPVLLAVNRHGSLPAPAWITRRTAGVRHIAELQGRDLATVAGSRDPLGAMLPLAALEQAGVSPTSDQLYEAGDYSSALALLLHNNAHAAVSELGFVAPFLDKNDLVVTWAGKPVVAAGWYRREGWTEGAAVCELALARIQRGDDRQMFAAFPQWVEGFVWQDSQGLEVQ
ncbi:PhnD/SsuA/transferrin family substrate-binding protein [Marinobacter sp.]|uniref:PhnD/SsuA/transferrin family substrate-binding protein n=1 Tax=Marinobacter sp. TaxID=50741 RepID=UPI00384AB0CB